LVGTFCRKHFTTMLATRFFGSRMLHWDWNLYISNLLIKLYTIVSYLEALCAVVVVLPRGRGLREFPWKIWSPGGAAVPYIQVPGLATGIPECNLLDKGNWPNQFIIWRSLLFRISFHQNLVEKFQNPWCWNLLVKLIITVPISSPYDHFPQSY